MRNSVTAPEPHHPEYYNRELDDYEQGAMDCIMGSEPEENASAEYLQGYGRQYEEDESEK